MFGADAIGLNFFAGPRRISLDRAAELLPSLPPLVTPVALTSGPTTEFPDAPTIAEIRAGPATAGRSPLAINTFQFYGTTLYLAETSPRNAIKVWSVCAIGEGSILDRILSHLTSLTFHPSTLVVDAASTGQRGGTGRKLDWSKLAEAVSLCLQKEAFHHLILAGGLTPENVAEAIRIVKPYAVDVSSGVEVAGKPGVKDPIKIRDFIQAAKSVQIP